MKVEQAITLVNFVQEARSRKQEYGATLVHFSKEIIKDMILEAIAKGYAEDNQKIADIALWLNKEEE